MSDFQPAILGQLTPSAICLRILQTCSYGRWHPSRSLRTTGLPATSERLSPRPRWSSGFTSYSKLFVR